MTTAVMNGNFSGASLFLEYDPNHQSRDGYGHGAIALGEFAFIAAPDENSVINLHAEMVVPKGLSEFKPQPAYLGSFIMKSTISMQKIALPVILPNWKTDTIVRVENRTGQTMHEGLWKVSIIRIGSEEYEAALTGAK